MKIIPSIKILSMSRFPVLATFIAIFSLAGCATELQNRFQAHINYLASDDLGGRGVGTDGIELAARYIAQQFEALGLEPAGDHGTYFQSFPLTMYRTLTEECSLTFSDDPSARQVKRDYIPFRFSSNDSFSGPLAFCGYGIVVEDKDRNDFVHIDVKDKVVLVFRGEPSSWADSDGYPSRYASFRNKIYNAKDRGALAVLIVNQKHEENDADDLIPFRAKGAENYGIPAFHISRAMAERALLLEGNKSLDELQERLNKGAYLSANWSKTTVTGYAGFKVIESPTKNVIGMLRGSGPAADENIVIGAHYDHLGKTIPMMRRFRKGKLVSSTSTTPQIHNGADDNASGVAGIIEIASMFVESKQRPQRSILFIAFTAEESGLHGSKYFVEHPTVDIDKTAAMLNLDMIGRMGFMSNRIQIFGAESGDSLPEILYSTAKNVGLSILPTNETGNRSDHASFIRKNIPAMHFYTGGHTDYHKPSDDAHKINSTGGVKVVAMVYEIARHLALMDKKPQFQKIKRNNKNQPEDSDNLPTYKVVMGLAPGYGEDGKEGMQVDSVSLEGPADVAGMKADDRIVEINGKKVANVYDYMAAMRNNKAGDSVEVIVHRKDKRITFQVTLAPAR